MRVWRISRLLKVQKHGINNWWWQNEPKYKKMKCKKWNLLETINLIAARDINLILSIATIWGTLLHTIKNTYRIYSSISVSYKVKFNIVIENEIRNDKIQNDYYLTMTSKSLSSPLLYACKIYCYNSIFNMCHI